MATATSSVVCDNSTLANFKSWAQVISNAFASFGWTQTADSGQVNWGTIASVPSSAYVYEIWKAADSQASTTPIYIKVEYGFSATAIRIRLTTGSGSNGSGTITGSIMGPYVITEAAGSILNQGATTFSCYLSGDSGEFRAMMWQTSTIAECVFGIERSKDSSGAKTTDYVTFVAVNAASLTGWVQQSMATGSSNVTPAEVNLMTFTSTSSGPQTEFYSVPGTTAANPIIPLVGYPGNQMLGFCSAAAADVAESNGTTITVNMYGANHAFLATKQNELIFIGRFANGSNSGALLMRYE
jgi:hypothetical protein